MNQIRTMALACAIFIAPITGCQVLQNNPELVNTVAKTIIDIGLRVAVSKFVTEDSGIRPHLQDIAYIIREPIAAASPEILRGRLDVFIDERVKDTVYRQAITDVTDMITDFYTAVYEKHKDNPLPFGHYTDILNRLGFAIEAGLSENAIESLEYRIETESAIIIIE